MAFSSELIVKTAIETLKIESQTIANLTDSINDQFVKAVKGVYDSKGRVIVTGVGKSALVGRKIVATLNSTGTPAIFMHAADAIHGDLGMIQSDDMVLCISKSGETAEIKVLVPMLRYFGSQLIAMTSRENSYLAKQADFLLHTPVSKEAEPNNLAPTASSVAQMSMGDALATALLALRGFTPNDFAQFHPGGLLGKQLYLRVKDLCHYNEPPSVKMDANVRQTILEMTSKRLGCTVILDELAQVQGIITDGDLRRMLEQKENVSDLRASDIMTSHPKCVQQDLLSVKALEIMRQHSITQLVVLDKEKYVGILHLHDLIREGLV